MLLGGLAAAGVAAGCAALFLAEEISPPVRNHASHGVESQAVGRAAPPVAAEILSTTSSEDELVLARHVSRAEEDSVAEGEESSEADPLGEVEIELTIDGQRVSEPHVRYRLGEEESWVSAEIRAGLAILPIAPSGEEELDFEILGAKSETLAAAFADTFEVWDDLRHRHSLYGGEADFSCAGRALEGESHLTLHAFTSRKIWGRVASERGRPASGAEVNVRGRTTWTNAEGYYSLELPLSVSAWDVTVHAQDQRGRVGSTRIEHRSKFSGPAVEAKSRADIVISRLLRVRGSVADEDGEPLVARVAIEGCKPVMSGAKGEFEVKGVLPDPGGRLPRARRDVVVSREGYRPVILEDEELRSGSKLVCVMVKTRPLRGQVLDATGKPVKGAWIGVSNRSDVQLLDTHCYSTGELLTSTTSDAAGRFELEVAPRQRFLGVRTPGRSPQLWSIGSEVKEVELTLPRSATISGRVLDSLGAPSSGTSITATLPGQPLLRPHQVRPEVGARAGVHRILFSARVASCQAGAEGEFRLDLPPGQYDLHLGTLSEEHLPVARGVPAGGPPVTLVEVARSSGLAQIHLEVSLGRKKLEAELFLKKSDEESYGYPSYTSSGKAVLWVGEGTHELWILAPGHLPHREVVSVRLNETVDLGVVALTRGGGRVEVRLPRREPFGALWVKFRDPAGGPTREVYAGNSDLRVLVSGLSPGLLTLSATLIDEDEVRAYEAKYPEVGPIELAINEGATTTVSLPLPD